MSHPLTNSQRGPVVNANSAESLTRGQLGVVQGNRERFAGLRDQFIGGVQTIAAERQQFGAATSSQAFQVLRDQGAGTNFASSLRRGLKVAKVRQGVMNRGEGAIRNQRLKDRLQLARSGVRRKGAALSLAQTGENIRSGVDIQTRAADDRGRAADADLIGTGLGAAAGVLTQNFKNNKNIFDFGIEGPGIFKQPEFAANLTRDLNVGNLDPSGFIDDFNPNLGLSRNA